jgi:hypothetical protein
MAWNSVATTRSEQEDEFMIVYVVTEAKPLGVERYMFVKASKKEAEKALRNISPYMRSLSENRKNTSAYSADSSNRMFYFIHEEDI